MSTIPSRTNYKLNSQYNIRSLFVEGYQLKPAESQFFVDLTPSGSSSVVTPVTYGMPMVWKNIVPEDGVITGGTVMPLTATYEATTSTWTTNGTLACFALTATKEDGINVGIQGAYQGTIVVDMVDLSQVSQTTNEVFTFVDLINTSSHMEGVLLSPSVTSGKALYNLLGISAKA